MKSLFLKKLITTITITILTGIVSVIYPIYKDRIGIEFEILSEVNVLDVNEKIENLDIFYNGESLSAQNGNLKIVNLKIKNFGQKNISQTHYDDNELLGFIIYNGKLIKKPEILESGSDYLKDNFFINIIDENQVRFSKFIFDSGDYIVLKILVFHDINNNPLITPLGKISGVKDIKLYYLSDSEETFVNKHFGGDILVQIIRGVSYFLIVTLMLILIFMFVDKISNIKERRKRKIIVKEFKNINTYINGLEQNKIINKFIKDGFFELKSMHHLINNENLIHIEYKKYLDNMHKMAGHKYERGVHFHLLNKYDSINNMIDLGIIKEIKTNGKKKVIIQKTERDFYKKFIGFLYKKYPENKNLFFN